MFPILLLVYKIGLVLRITDIAAKGCFGCGFKSQNSKKNWREAGSGFIFPAGRAERVTRNSELGTWPTRRVIELVELYEPNRLYEPNSTLE